MTLKFKIYYEILDNLQMTAKIVNQVARFYYDESNPLVFCKYLVPHAWNNFLPCIKLLDNTISNKKNLKLFIWVEAFWSYQQNCVQWRQSNNSQITQLKKKS